METTHSIKVIDQMGRTVHVPPRPQRIISLVPSQTELLYYFGLEAEVAGVTKFCVHPNSWYRTKTRVGGTKKLDFEKIKQLNPDLIIGNKEENEQSQVEELMKLYPVWMSDIKKLEEAYEMITGIGKLIGKEAKASQLVTDIKAEFKKLRPLNTELRTLYLIWKDPYMVAGSDTFVNDLLIRCGLKNLAADRYPELTNEAIKTLAPQVILLSSEPYPFKEKHLDELQLLCPDAIIHLVDGELFSWYGSRLLYAPAYFSKLIYQIKSF